MDCEETRNLLGAYGDENVEAGERIAVEAHLSECVDCREEREALRSVDAVLTRSLLTQRRRADIVADRVLQDFAVGDRRQGTTSRILHGPLIRAVSYLLAGAAGFLLAMGLFQPWKNDDPKIVLGRPAQIRVDAGPAFATPVAHLVHATGPVSFRMPTDETWVSVAQGSLPTFTCPSESAVRTETGSLCELETTSGSRIRLNESSEIALRSDQELVLVKGQIWCRTAQNEVLRVLAEEAPQPDGQWLLNCPTRTACLTSCSVEGPIQVVAAAGKVDLIVNGTAQEIPSGSSGILDDGKLTVRESADELLQAERWMQPLLTLGGHSNAELTRRVDALLARIGQVKLSSLYEQDLRNLGEYGALPLLRFVQARDSRQEPSRRLVAIRILADTAPIWMVPDFIALLEDGDPDVRGFAASALTRLTGETQGLTTSVWQGDRPQWNQGVLSWQEWWQQHRDSCSPPPPGV